MLDVIDVGELWTLMANFPQGVVRELTDASVDDKDFHDRFSA